MGINWLYSFIKRTPGLKTKYNRKLDYQRYKQEEPAIIQAWFDLVRNVKAEYGIQDEDSYNFDESGFQMGIITQQKVVTGSERRHRPKAVQPGNREWVTVIQGIGTFGYALPPFIIYKGKNYLFV